LKKRSKEDTLDVIEGIIEEMGPMTSSVLNAMLLERKSVNKSLYTSPCALGCWMRCDSRFQVVGKEKGSKNIWGLK
jgi:hypothetical protein